MNEKKHDNYYMEYICMLVITGIICTISFIIYKLPTLIMIISFIFIMAATVLLWLRKLTKKNLYLNDFLNLLAPNIIALFFVSNLIKSKSTIIGFMLGVAIMDVFSFTKRGKNTLNAKLAGNINTMARLSICLPIPGKPGLQQIIGVGDLFYYSMITMYYIHFAGILASLKAVLIIFIGQLVNIVSIILLKRIQKNLYKGFPATLFPCVFIIIADCLHMI